MNITASWLYNSQLRWVEELTKIYCGPTKVERLVRAGMLADTKHSQKPHRNHQREQTYKLINVSCDFFNGVRISSNASTILYSKEHKVEVNWEINNFYQENIKVCCPYVDEVKINSYLQCVNIDCKRNVVPQGIETKVTCMNNGCKRKMIVRRCSRQINVQVISYWEGRKKQQNVTNVFLIFSKK